MGLKLAVVCYYIIFSCSNSCCVFCNKTPTIFVADRRGRKKRMKTSTQQSITSTSKDVLLQDKIKVFLFLFFSYFFRFYLFIFFFFFYFLFFILLYYFFFLFFSKMFKILNNCSIFINIIPKFPHFFMSLKIVRVFAKNVRNF